jgi:hypothetical protein
MKKSTLLAFLVIGLLVLLSWAITACEKEYTIYNTINDSTVVNIINDQQNEDINISKVNILDPIYIGMSKDSLLKLFCNNMEVYTDRGRMIQFKYTDNYARVYFDTANVVDEIRLYSYPVSRDTIYNNNYVDELFLLYNYATTKDVIWDEFPIITKYTLLAFTGYYHDLEQAVLYSKFIDKNMVFCLYGTTWNKYDRILYLQQSKIVN